MWVRQVSGAQACRLLFFYSVGKEWGKAEKDVKVKEEKAHPTITSVGLGLN